METNVELLNRCLELGRGLNPQDWPANADPILLTPNGVTVHDVSKYCEPRRIQATAEFRDPTSFVMYVNRFKTIATMLTAWLPVAGNPSVVAHLDYHTPPYKPGWRRHQATFAPEITPEFKEWMEKDRENMTQMDFALWLEDNRDMLIEPGGAELLELVLSLEGKSDVRFSTAIKLQTGATKLIFDEEVTVRGQATPTTKPGEMEIPKTVTARMSVYHGLPPIDITARLKYCIKDRALQLRMETPNLPRLLRDVSMKMLLTIATDTELPVLNGVVK